MASSGSFKIFSGKTTDDLHKEWGLFPCLKATVVIVHTGDKPAPFIARFAVSHQWSRAIFARPVVVWNHVA